MLNRKTKNKKIIVGSATLLVLVLVLVGLEKAQVINLYKSKEKYTLQDEKAKVNYSEATATEKKESDDHKAQIRDDKSFTNTPPPQGQSASTVKPIITFAGQYGVKVEVGSYVPGIYETGACSLVLTQGPHRVTRQTTAIKDANRTVCPTFSIDRSELRAGGSWVATVTYSSNTSSGASDVKQFGVQ